MKRRFFLLISSLFLVFVSCKGVLQEPTLMGENKTVTVKGTLTLPNEFNEAKNLTRVATPRTALPSIPSIATYTISATDGTSSINGTVDTSANPLTYEIALTEGSWTLTASGKDASSNVILSGTASVTILSGTTSPTPITLSMNKTSGTGSINLSVKASATKITKATVKFTAKSGGAAPSDVTLSFSSSSREQAISVASVAVGSYEIAISFFDANNALLYFCTDAVNVFENLETSTWKDSGEFVDSSGNFDVTESLVTKFARSTFYVASNTATPAGNDTTGNGSYFAPFASMQKALSAVRVANDGTSEYKIFVSGEITGNNAKVSLTATNVTSALNLTITSASNTKATLDATGVNIGVISIESTNANVTLEKLIIKNGNAEKGAGIYAKDCTLAVTNCEVNTNTATAMLGGGGIYIDSTANATLEDTTIQDNSASSGYAGGLHIATSGTVTLTSCTIQGNTAQNGGGIYARSGSTVTITGGEIKNNTVTTSQIASGLGGGICVVNSTFSITGTSITGNTATNTATGEKSQGGGITIGNNTLKTTITGCTIQGNSADTGGGLYLGVASDVTLDGCTITQNTGGVDISNSVAILNNCAIQNNTQNGGVYVFAGENGGVGQTYNVTLDACTISGNKNSHNATSGVCIEHYGQGSGTFNVKGATIIGSGTEDSNIYWEDSQFRINIPESLADEAYIKLSPGYSGVAINDEILTGAAGAITTDVCEKFHVTAPSNLVIAPNSDGTKGVLKSSVINIDRTQLATVKNAPTKTEYEVGTDKADVDLTGLVVTLALQGGG